MFFILLTRGATALDVMLQTHHSQQKRLRRFKGVKPTATSIVQASGEATQSVAAGRVIRMFEVELVDPH